VQLFFDSRGPRLGTGDRRFGVAELCPTKVEFPLRDRLDLDQGFGSVERGALDLTVGLRLTKGRLLRQILSNELSQLDVVVGQERLAGTNATPKTHGYLLNDSTRKGPNVSHARLVGRHDSRHLECARYARRRHRCAFDSCILLSCFWDLDCPSWQLASVFCSGRRFPHPAAYQPYRASANGNAHREDEHQDPQGTPRSIGFCVQIIHDVT
jgi:hypothetical protein